MIDFALPAGSPIEKLIAGGAAAQGILALEVEWSGKHDPAVDSSPRTAWQADKTRFVTRPRSSDHTRGMLRLDHAGDTWGVVEKEVQTDFDVYQVDPDGAALKTTDFLLSAQNLVARSLKPGTDGAVTYTTGDDQPVAALRSGGLGVARHGRAVQVAAGAASAALKNQAIETSPAASKDVVLFTEDVLRGYRVDVAPVPDPFKGGPWHSLCERTGQYEVVKTGRRLTLPDDEGYVKGASTTSTASEGVDPDDHYLHESLFRWAGWSLVATRPGRTLRARGVEGSELQGESPETVEDVAVKGNGLAVSFTARKGSLPRLRFGQLYRFRARTVDLAGNSLALGDRSLGELDNATDAVGYWRFEPVDPPALVLRDRLSEGESLERMVIRSNAGMDPGAYLSSPDFANAIALPASQDFAYAKVDERHFVPPKSSQLQCEQHGLFDDLMGSPDGIRKAYGIAARESGTLYDPLPDSRIELVTPSSLDGVARTLAVPPALPSAENPVGDRLAPGQYVIHREEAVETPYLPDPAAGGIALRAMPGSWLPGVKAPMVLGPSAAVVYSPEKELVLVVGGGGEWPHTRGFRLVIAERPATLTPCPCAEKFVSDGAPKWDEEHRVLTLFVAKGRIIRLRYASFVHKDYLQALGLPAWSSAGGERNFVLGMAHVGCHWMVTPYRALTLVHATQQPICEPELERLSILRMPGDQHVLLRTPVRLHGPSSGKFEIEAFWSEWVDDLEKPGPVLVERCQGQLGEIQLPENHVNSFGLEQAVAAQAVDPSRTRARGNRHDFGDTKFRLIQYRIRATTRFREYLPPSLYADREKVTRTGPFAAGHRPLPTAPGDAGAPVLLDPSAVGEHTVVRSSAPPDEPKVLYVVPTFRWIRSGPGAGGREQTRLGNGLRVYLDRPWFSSGDGELLGVVLPGEDKLFTSIAGEELPFVTQWGMDPIWDSEKPKVLGRAADFPLRVAEETVILQERSGTGAQPGTRVQVVGHRVHWDPVRALWYCDIELDAGRSYMPFVRLALVRYQPQSITLEPAAPDQPRFSAKISKVVLSEFAQVLPRRRAVVEVQGTSVKVRLHGTVPNMGSVRQGLDKAFVEERPLMVPMMMMTNPELGRNKVEVVLQTRDPAIDSDLAWHDAATLASSIVAPATGLLPFISGATVSPAVSTATAAPLFNQPARAAPTGVATLRDRLGRVVNLETVLDVGASRVGVRPGIEVHPGVGFLMDPHFWEGSATLPATGGRPARLVVREFERYYTDRTVPEKVGDEVRRRRVVEERLVFSAEFPLE